MSRRAHLEESKVIVIKIGSSSLTHQTTGHISLQKMEKLVRQIADLKNSGKKVVLVSSGAQAVGTSVLRLKERPTEIAKKQAVASVGQASLMMLYNKLFKEYNIVVSQVLITKDIIDEPRRRKNAINTFQALLAYDVLPIVNENDTVATDEIEIGDNDTLSAIVAELIQANLLILLSDIEGLYNQDPTQFPEAVLIEEVTQVDNQIMKMGTGTATIMGTGGMVTKLEAARLANHHNIEMVIAHSETTHVVQRILKGENIGTLFTWENRSRRYYGSGKNRTY